MASKGGSINERVRAIAEPFAKELGLEIWDVRFVKEGAEHYLRIFIDKEDGVLIEDCVALSRAVDGPIDEADPIDVPYTLEVSSPGAERKLTRDRHYERTVGKPVIVKLIRPMDGKRIYEGVLTAYEKGNATIETEERTFTINKKDVSFVKWNDLSSYFA